MTYFRGAQLKPLLTADEERALAREIEAGRAADDRLADGSSRPGDHQLADRGRRARRDFVEANLRLVVSVAQSMRAPAHVDREDMIQDGVLGLERAVDKFDWTKGYKFSTYATWWIRQGMQRGLETTISTVRIPAHRTSELGVALAGVEGDPNRLPPKLANVLSMSSWTSIDQPRDDDKATLSLRLESPDHGPEIVVEDAHLRETVRGLVRRLDPDSRFAVSRRFGLGEDEPATYVEIAAELGVSPEAVRRRVARALESLRSPAMVLAA